MASDEKANILLVDDRIDGLLALEVALRDSAYHLIRANSGKEALRFLMENEEKIAVILMDVQMPRLDGFETASIIKMEERYRHVPIIFVTGIHGDPRMVTQGYELGAIDYVVKPFQPKILKSKVAVLVELQRKTKLLRQLQEREHQHVLSETKRQLKEAFLTKERKLISLVENSPDFIAIADRTSRLVYLNQAGRELVGIENEADLLEKSIPDFFPARDREVFSKEVLPKALETGKWEGEFCFQHFKTQREIPVWSRGFIIQDPKTGEIDAIATISRDISQQKTHERQLRESELKFRKLASFAPVGIFSTDAQNRYLYVNRYWEEFSGLSEEEAKSDNGERWMSALHPEDRETAVREWNAKVAAGEEFSAQFRFLSADGRITWIQSRAIPISDEQDTVTAYIGCCVDMTERIRNEVALKNAATQLARSNAELERFAWVASHDLKEPLRTVSSYVRLLEREYKGKLDSHADTYIRYAVEGASRMYSLIDSILAFSGIERMTQPPRQVDCNLILETVLSNLQISIRECKARITHTELPTLLADSSQMGLLFQNLISNAIKFRRDESPLVEISATPVGDDWVFTFRDNGIGIAPQYQERIFGVFQRLHTTQQFPGTGVGLAICKKIIEKHGGKIWVESTPGKGSTFHFSLPQNPLPRENPICRVFSEGEKAAIAGNA